MTATLRYTIPNARVDILIELLKLLDPYAEICVQTAYPPGDGHTSSLVITICDNQVFIEGKQEPTHDNPLPPFS